MLLMQPVRFMAEWIASKWNQIIGSISGIIAWHDCTPSHPEVVSYLKSFNPMPKLVRGTALAFISKP